MKVTLLPILEEKTKSFSDYKIVFTEAALDAFYDAWETDGVLRVGAKGGGCSGLSYRLDFIPLSEIDSEEDLVHVIRHKEKDLTFVLDIFSAEYLKDMKIDYVKSLQETGFKFDNPNAKRHCGCGKSFGV